MQLCIQSCTTSARPEVRGTADVGWRSLNPTSDQSSSYALTTISSHVSSDRRAVTDMNGERRGRCVAHHFNAVCGDGGGVCRGPRPATSFGPQHELPPARLAIHRTDLCS